MRRTICSILRACPAHSVRLVPLIATFAALVPASSEAWIFHEHQVIAERGIQALAQDQLNAFDGLWSELRQLAPKRFCQDPDAVTYNDDGRPTCLAFSSLPAIAGDHSCSAENLWQIAAKTGWVMKVAQIAHQTRLKLAKAKGRDRLNVWNYSNLRFERTDPDYSSRAGANFAHFTLHRISAKYKEYMRRSLLSDTPINSAAVFSLNHWAAIRFALQAAKLPKADPNRAELLRRAFTAEAFAIHFLQDAFAAGHVVGQWGGASDAKGTHDHYSINGIDGVTWEGFSYSAYGDAHQSEIDLEQSHQAVTFVLKQLLRAFSGDSELEAQLAEFDLEDAVKYRDIDTCKATWVSARVPSPRAMEVILPAWKKTLKPSPGPDAAHLPRFKAEIGSFIGFGFNVRMGGSFGGYDTKASDPRFLVDVAGFVQFGFGVEGATGTSSDGTFMVGVGLHGQAPQFGASSIENPFGSAGENLPRVPGRLGLAFQVRLPFYLLPADLLVFGPLIAWISFDTVKDMAVIAADGGLIPWQTVFVTSAGDFQFVVGREIQLSLFALGGSDVFYRFQNDPDQQLKAINFSSIELDFPAFQWRIFRAFSQRLTSALVITVGGGIDIPYGARGLLDGASTSIDPTGFFYFRFSFDGRIYFRGPLEKQTE